MPNDAVEQIVNCWIQHGSPQYAGLIGLDVREDNTIIGSQFEEKETTLTDFYANGGTGDKKIVYRTEVIKQYPEYPLFEGERYVGLAYKYMLIDQDYKLLTINKPLVIVDYQPDGSSNQMFRQYWNNPKGFAFYRLTEMKLHPKLSRRYMSCIHYVSSCIIAKDKKFIQKSNQKVLTLLALIPGTLLFLYIKHKIKTNATLNVK